MLCMMNRLKVIAIFLFRLQILDWFSHCSLQIGDFAQYIIKPSDELVEVPSKFSFIPDVLLSELADHDTVTEHKPEESTQSEDPKSVDTEEATAVVNGDVGNEAEAGADEDEEYEDIDTSENESEEEKCSKKMVSRHKGKKGLKFGTGGKKGGKRPKQSVKFEPEYPQCVVGEKVPVGICYTFSTATVMWQVSIDFSIYYIASLSANSPLFNLFIYWIYCL